MITTDDTTLRIIRGVLHEISNPVGTIKLDIALIGKIWQDIMNAGPELAIPERVAGMNRIDLPNVVPEMITGISEGAERIGLLINDLRIFLPQFTPRNEKDSSMDLGEMTDRLIRLCSFDIRKSIRKFKYNRMTITTILSGSRHTWLNAMAGFILDICNESPDGLRIEWETSAQILSFHVTGLAGEKAKPLADRAREVLTKGIVSSVNLEASPDPLIVGFGVSSEKEQ